MPYETRKVGSGYKVFKKGTSKSFSKKPLPKERAKAQMRALYMNETTNPIEIITGKRNKLADGSGIKLKSLHAPGKRKTIVIQPEERQQTGERDATHWYQKYHKKAPVYHQSKRTGPYPEGYKEHILH
jgi:hypothetical protein